jgi:WD40 repeat protein
MMTRVQVKRLHALTGHRDCVYALCASAEPHQVFSAGGDGLVARWDLEHPEEGDLIARLPNSVYALNFHERTGALVAGHNLDGIHVLDPGVKREIYSLQLTHGSIFDIQSHGNSIYVATSEGEIVVVDEPGRITKARIATSGKSARTIAINPLSGEYAVGGSDHHIRIFDLDTDAVKKDWQAHKNSVFTLRYSPDGKLLLSGSRDAHLGIWNVEQAYEPLDDIAAHLYAINHIAFSPDGKHFVTCSMDKSIKVWDASNGKLLKVIDKARHAGHGTSVNKLLWTSFNNRLVSASDDRTISVWDLFFEL